MEWKEVRLGDISTMKYGKLCPPKTFGKIPIHSGYRIVGYTNQPNCPANTIIVVARGVGGCGDVKLLKEPVFLTNLSISVSIDSQVCLPQYFYYSHLLRNLRWLDSGSAQSQITIEDLKKYTFSIPSLNIQKKIVAQLSEIDEKIAVNRRICENLEAQAQALFKHWFIDFSPFKDGKFVESELGMIPEGWRVGTLTEIAEYLNGLAMQKFPPISDDDAIPVLKIKELGQSQCDNNSDKCSKQIKPEYIIKNGDVVFSWSGTLMVDIWCGGICGLNQHLFKVTSDNYPKWFYLMWTKHHLAEFVRIAKDKAVTMGHIKRGDLEKALVAIPDSDTLDKMSKVMEDILNQIINARLESNTLSTLRDTLLPKLMSGQIIV